MLVPTKNDVAGNGSAAGLSGPAAYLTEMVRGGHLIGVSGAAVKVLAVYVAHAGTQHGLLSAYPGTSLIQRLTGLDLSSVRRANKELVERGLIFRQTLTTGRQAATTYLRLPVSSVPPVSPARPPTRLPGETPPVSPARPRTPH